MWLLDADFRQPFELGHRSAVFTTLFHGQFTMDDMVLYGVDRISIGNRYTVRGSDGKYTLMAGTGWFLRNEVANQLPHEIAMASSFLIVKGYWPWLISRSADGIL